ncbi:hypothetical protein [Microbacterium sp. 4R-513]|uniref:hypothetical protein n=1 Tax=Microbacterium sp. 4R-513 TaxID=2567934 RepID=UPI001F499D04|nr:hypothetical protein [Microbacterium sp. 4R-513]
MTAWGIASFTLTLMALALTGCAQPAAPVIEPVVMEAGDLQGQTVKLVVGQVLDIDTGSLAVDSYSGEVSDPNVAEFVPGHEDGGALYNPGVKGLAEGTTEVVLKNSDGGIQNVTFTVEVSD